MVFTMSPEEVRDGVLSVLCATDGSLKAEEIREQVQPTPELREVRVALRDLTSDGEIRIDGPGRWAAIAARLRFTVPSRTMNAVSSEDFRRALVALKNRAR